MSHLSSGVQLQHAVKGAASAEVRFLEHVGRHVVWVDIDAEYHRGALSAEASGVMFSEERIVTSSDATDVEPAVLTAVTALT